MTVIYPTKNYYEDEDGNKPDRMVYDLNEEKKMIAEATEEIKKELWEKWKKRYAGAQIFPSKLDTINPNLVDFLLSFDNTLFYNDLAKNFGLSQEQRDVLPQIIWQMAIDKNWDAAANLITKKLGLNPSVSNQVIDSINRKILLKAKELSESKFIPQRKEIAAQKSETKKLDISLSDAIKRYPNLGEQLITASPIKLRIFPQPVRPSIKNWIEDYHQNMGAQKHGMMERGNYLFHSENTKRLTSGERKKLGEILRSLDEGVTLKIDPDRQEVVFEESAGIKSTGHRVNRSSSQQVIEPTNQAPNNFRELNSKVPNRPLPGSREVLPQNIPTPNSQAHNPNVRFSSPQVMPSERKRELGQRVNGPSSQQAIGPSVARPLETARNNFSNQPIFNPQAGKPWEPHSGNVQTEPKIRGNVVDLKN